MKTKVILCALATSLLWLCSCTHKEEVPTRYTDQLNFGLTTDVSRIKLYHYYDEEDLLLNKPMAEVIVEFNDLGQLMVDMENNLISYDELGKFVAGPNPYYQLVRDEQGRIASIRNINPEDSLARGFTWVPQYDEKGLIIAEDSSYKNADIESMHIDYERDEHGRLLSYNAVRTSADGIVLKAAMDYKYLDIDHKGNWTKRMVHTVYDRPVVKHDGTTVVSQSEMEIIEVQQLEYYPESNQQEG